MKIATLISFFLLSFYAFAGGDKGNGGDVIICPGKAPQLYDHYEGAQREGRHLNLGDASLPIEEKVEIVFKRLDRFDQHRANIYRGWFKSFMNEAAFLKGIDLIDIPDTGDGYIPKGCELKQLVVQKNPDPLRPNDKRYTINAEYWKLMDNDEKAGTILHELILRELINQYYWEHSDSKTARYLNSWFSDADFEKESYFTYITTLVNGKVKSLGGAHGSELRFQSNNFADIKFDDVPGVGVFYRGSTSLNYNKSASCYNLNIDGENKKICADNLSGYPGGWQAKILEDGQSAFIKTQEDYVIGRFGNGWETYYRSGTSLVIGPRSEDSYTLWGAIESRQFVRHPILLKKGCKLKASYEAGTLSPYLDVAYYRPLTNFETNSFACDAWELDTAIGKLESDNVTTFSFPLIISNQIVEFSLEKGSVILLNLKFSKGKFESKDGLLNPVELISSTFQMAFDGNGRRVEIVKDASVMINSDGIVTSCVQPNGRYCKTKRP